MNAPVAPRLLTPYHPRQAARARRYARALAIVNVKIDDLSDRVCGHLIATGDAQAARQVRRKFQDVVVDIDNLIRPKFLDSIDAWSRDTSPDELRRLGVVAPDAPFRRPGR